MQTTHIFWWVPGKSAPLTRSFPTLRLGLRLTISSLPSKNPRAHCLPTRLGASVDPTPILQGAIRVTSMRILGVTISSNLTMGCHLDEILSSSASSIHALRMLRSHGLGSPQLFEVARSTTLASMLYASSAWWGFTTAQDRDRLERLMGRLRRGVSPGSNSVIW